MLGRLSLQEVVNATSTGESRRVEECYPKKSQLVTILLLDPRAKYKEYFHELVMNRGLKWEQLRLGLVMHEDKQATNDRRSFTALVRSFSRNSVVVQRHRHGEMLVEGFSEKLAASGALGARETRDSVFIRNFKI